MMGQGTGALVLVIISSRGALIIKQPTMLCNLVLLLHICFFIHTLVQVFKLQAGGGWTAWQGSAIFYIWKCVSCVCVRVCMRVFVLYVFFFKRYNCIAHEKWPHSSEGINTEWTMYQEKKSCLNFFLSIWPFFQNTWFVFAVALGSFYFCLIQILKGQHVHIKYCRPASMRSADFPGVNCVHPGRSRSYCSTLLQ